MNRVFQIDRDKHRWTFPDHVTTCMFSVDPILSILRGTLEYQHCYQTRAERLCVSTEAKMHSASLSARIPVHRNLGDEQETHDGKCKG